MLPVIPSQRAIGTERQSAPRHHVAAFDVIRGWAVLLVLAFHFNVPGAQAAGRIGVTLFFVLSGYLITHHLAAALAEDGRGLGVVTRHYRRRALRILPPLAVMLLVVTAIATAVGTVTIVGPAAVSSAFMVANLPAPLGVDLLWLSHMWSLSVEAQFYLVLPVLLVAGFIHRFVAAAVIVGAATVLVLYPAASGLGIGCLLAVAGARAVPRLWPPLLTLAGCAVMLVSATMDNQSAYYHLVPAWTASVGAGLIVGAAAARTSSSTANPVKRVGQISYSLYLWHLPIGAVLFPAAYAAGYPWWVAAVAAVALSVATAEISYRFVESPFMTAVSRKSSAARWRAVAAASGFATRYAAVPVESRSP